MHDKGRHPCARPLLWLCLAALGSGACREGGPHAPADVHTTIHAFQGDIHAPDTRELLVGIEAYPLQPEGGPIRVLGRTHGLSRFPCTSCHAPNMQTPPGQAAHWGLALQHGSPDTMNCQTCHAAEVPSLKTLTGEPVDFDQAYNLCGQCHFEQRRDWVGGAHGKRVAAWAGDRIMRNCTDCHDPHDPGFPTRYPAMAPGPVNTYRTEVTP